MAPKKGATSGGGGKQKNEIRYDSKRSKGKQKEFLFHRASYADMLSEASMLNLITPSAMFERLTVEHSVELSLDAFDAFDAFEELLQTKWCKGKQKEKVNTAVLFDQANYVKMLSEVPKYKQITPSVIPERSWAPKEKALHLSSKPATSCRGKQKEEIQSDSKWSKGKQKEKVSTAVLFDQTNYVKMLSEVPKYKQITPSVISERSWQLTSEKVPTRGSSVAPSHSVAAGSKPSAQMQKNSYIQATPAGTTPALSPIPESAQLAMAINASIQSAIAEGVPVNLNDLCMRSNKTGDSEEYSSNKTVGSCVICLDAPAEGACSPCGHMAGCMSCLNMIEKKNGICPVCCAKIDQVLRLYRV